MKQFISNTEFEAAYNNLDNRKIINACISRYIKIMPIEELQECGMVALWKCLKYHEDGHNQKFTTSLWRFIDWECRRELKKKNKDKTLVTSDMQEYDVTVIENPDVIKLRDCIEHLKPEHQQIIQEYYFDKLTMEEIGDNHKYSKETARQKINKAVRALSKIYNGV